jgi:hypothetical protein
MNKKNKITIGFADISIGFHFPSEIEIPKEFEEFLIEQEEEPDAEYEIRLLDEPLQISGEPLSSYQGMLTALVNFAVTVTLSVLVIRVLNHS